MNSLSIKKQLQSWGLYLVPTQTNNPKKPKTVWAGEYDRKGKKKFVWKKDKDGAWLDWKEEDFNDSFAVNLERSGLLTVDIDNDCAFSFRHLLPQDTLITGKEINGKLEQTHFHYKVAKQKSFSCALGLTEEESETEKDISLETLTNTCAVISSAERKVINLAEPKALDEIEFNNLKCTIKLIGALSILYKRAPRVAGQSHNYYFYLSGCLAPLQQTLKFKENILEELSTAHGKDYSEYETMCAEQVKTLDTKGDNSVATIETLIKHVNKWAPAVKNMPFLQLLDGSKDKFNRKLISAKFGDFIQKKYPVEKHILFPICAHPNMTQIWGTEGHGKSWVAMQYATSLASGTDFLKYNWVKGVSPQPVLYVDGELPGGTVQDRFCQLANEDQTVLANLSKYLNVSSFMDQPEYSYSGINVEQGRKNIEEEAQRISAEHNGIRPHIFLDNISMLVQDGFNEKEGAEWTPIMKWLSKLRGMGYSVYFVHHATKPVGNKTSASGSNVKDRHVNISMHVAEADSSNLIEDFEGLQSVVSFTKWREYKGTKHGKPFIARLKQDSSDWEIQDEIYKTGKQQKVIDLINSGELWNSNRTDEENKKVFGCSRDTYFKLKKQQTQTLKVKEII